ncbi:glutaminyl-peptide cyclotransferase [Frateuria aurantia]
MRLTALLLLCLASLCPVAGFAGDAVEHLGYKVVRTYPHRTDAFTEGLFYEHGALYESTGMNGQSAIRKVDLATGKVLQQVDLEPDYFGEGIISWGPRLIQLTWRSNVGFIYDLATMQRQGSFTYQGEGWGLTRNAHQLIMSDGTSRLRLLDPQTLQQTGQLQVTEAGRPVTQINELEWVKGRIFANVWQTQRIIEIDPASGKVVADIDLNGLLPASIRLPEPADDVLNGIAYDPEHDRLFVTGKRWPYLYQIKLVPEKPSR